jgi:hypothetical protein
LLGAAAMVDIHPGHTNIAPAQRFRGQRSAI